MAREWEFDNDRLVLVGDLFAKPEKDYLRYGIVLGFEEEGYIRVQMSDLPKPTRVLGLESSIFVTPEFIPKCWRSEKLGFKDE